MTSLTGDRDSMVNSGLPVDGVSERQRRRKMAHFKDNVDKALWFADSFGLVPESLTVRAATSGVITTVDLKPRQQPSPQAVISTDSGKIMQTLYLLERFGVSDEFYHELTQVSVRTSHPMCILLVLVLTYF